MKSAIPFTSLKTTLFGKLLSRKDQKVIEEFEGILKSGIQTLVSDEAPDNTQATLDNIILKARGNAKASPPIQGSSALCYALYLSMLLQPASLMLNQGFFSFIKALKNKNERDTPVEERSKDQQKLLGYLRDYLMLRLPLPKENDRFKKALDDLNHPLKLLKDQLRACKKTLKNSARLGIFKKIFLRLQQGRLLFKLFRRRHDALAITIYGQLVALEAIIAPTNNELPPVQPNTFKSYLSDRAHEERLEYNRHLLVFEPHESLRKQQQKAALQSPVKISIEEQPDEGFQPILRQGAIQSNCDVQYDNVLTTTTQIETQVEVENILTEQADATASLALSYQVDTVSINFSGLPFLRLNCLPSEGEYYFSDRCNNYIGDLLTALEKIAQTRGLNFYYVLCSQGLRSSGEAQKETQKSYLPPLVILGLSEEDVRTSLSSLPNLTIEGIDRFIIKRGSPSDHGVLEFVTETLFKHRDYACYLLTRDLLNQESVKIEVQVFRNKSPAPKEEGRLEINLCYDILPVQIIYKRVRVGEPPEFEVFNSFTKKYEESAANFVSDYRNRLQTDEVFFQETMKAYRKRIEGLYDSSIMNSALMTFLLRLHPDLKGERYYLGGNDPLKNYVFLKFYPMLICYNHNLLQDCSSFVMKSVLRTSWLLCTGLIV